MNVNIKTRYFKNLKELSFEVSKFISDLMRKELKIKDYFSLFLSGGETPKKLYKILSTDKDINWEKIHIFWGDERYVPRYNEYSNYKMAYDSLLTLIKIPEENIHPIRTEFTKSIKSAEDYERELKAFLSNYSNNMESTFDLILLGVGKDGHTASIFPGDYKIEKDESWVKVVTKPEVEPKIKRITVTFQVINNHKYVIFLVGGEDKLEIVDKIIKDQRSGDSILPAGKVSPKNGKILWFIAKSE